MKRNASTKLRRLNRGFSLVELMVAMVISLFIVAVIAQLFISNKTIYRQNDSLSRLQENGRFVVEFLTRDIRETGYWGCAGFDPTNITNHLDTGDPAYDPSLHDFARGVEGTDNTGLNSSDTITLRGAKGDIQVIATPATPAAALLVVANNGLQQSQIALVSDCFATDIFQITNANPSTSGAVDHNLGAAVAPGNATQDMTKLYGTDATVMRAQVATYSLGTSASGEPSLMRSLDGGVPQELVEGVEDLQLLYGEDTDGDRAADFYVRADQVADWESIVSVRAFVLMRTREEINVAPVPVTFNGAVINPADRRSRRVFTATTSVRNRTL